MKPRLLFLFLLAIVSVVRAVATTPITFMQDGGWCWYQDPRAIIPDGQLVIGAVSGQTGDVKVSVYDLVAGVNLGTTVLHADFERDDHDVPAFYLRPDGRLLAMYAKHGTEKQHHLQISAPNDFLTWEVLPAQVYDYDDKRGVTYTNLHRVEKQDLLYNFYRDGETFNPTFITSADQGETWGNRTHFIADEVEGRQRPYPRYLQRDPDTVGIAFTDGHPRDYGNSLYYADFRDGAFFHVDGTRIKSVAEGPLRTSEAEKIYLGSETRERAPGTEYSTSSIVNSAWSCAVARDASGYPHLGYTLYWSNDDNRFRRAVWDGARWIDREIAFAGTCLYPREASYTGLMAFDPMDPATIYLSSDVDPGTGKSRGGVHEIYTARAEPEDDVSTIRWQAVTAGSTERNLRPIVVAGDGYKVVLWLSGPWHTYTDYATDVHGIILARP